ncbi:sialidase family protein [Alkalisalibacterium limincola]|uniref:Exo-alpha-sialidase n=1 Tax=Alkalisalibacterium limincola TaxID=2699169 RepID=A0A5C8KTU0_9GAMM|nr:sialidase family protein [Alkalisalibacterium limincola]TXK64536.1 exo-alpha-sialidase [Alkalisalibacterium limincola]
MKHSFVRSIALAALVVALVSGLLAGDRVAWQEPQVIASGGGHQGPWRMNESDFDYVDAPTAAIDASGTIAVVWVDQARKNLLFQRYSADGEAQMAEPVDVSRTPGVFSWLPRIALSDSRPDSVHVLWQEIIFSGGSHGGDILFARSDDGGRTFKEARNLSDDRAGAGKGRVTADFWHNGSLALAPGPDETLYAAWTDYEGDLWLSRSSDAGESFTAPRRVPGEDAAGPAFGPSLAVDAQGVVHVAWTLGERTDADVRVTRSEDGGETFAAPSSVHPGPGHVDAPQIAVDDEGTVHLVYGESVEGPMQRYRIKYARRARGEEAFTTPVDLSGRQLERFGSTGFPAIATGTDGHVYVSWEVFPAPGTRPNGLGFVYSIDRGETFSEPEVVPGSIDPDGGVNGSMQGLLGSKLAAGPDGQVLLVNSTFRSNDSSDVKLFRGAVNR